MPVLNRRRDETEEKPGHAQIGAATEKTVEDEAQEVNSEERDPTLQNPRCVFQVLKKHFARYTPELVENSCGVPKATFLEDRRDFTSRIRA